MFLGPDVVSSNGVGVAPRQIRVIESALVDRIEFDTTRSTPIAKRVHVIVGGKYCIYEARKKIAIAAGSVRTPGILERSGVGDPARPSPIGTQTVYACILCHVCTNQLVPCWKHM